MARVSGGRNFVKGRVKVFDRQREADDVQQDHGHQRSCRLPGLYNREGRPDFDFERMERVSEDGENVLIVVPEQ